MKAAMKKRDETYRAGLWSERAASVLLRLKGYRILERRFRTPVGEIDLIARRGRQLAFVEVKMRRDRIAALESLTPAMRRRIVHAAQYFMAGRADLSALDSRFDLITIVPPFFARHMAGAWRPES